MSPATRTAPVAELVSGSDPTVLSRLAGEALARLVGDADASLAVSEMREADYLAGDGPPSPAAVVEAARTPPMLSPHRVVVARELAVLSGEAALAPLLAYLAAPMETTRLLLVWEKGPGQSSAGRLPAALTKAVEAAGGACHRAEVGYGRAGRTWLDKQLAGADVSLDGDAADLLAAHLGEDRARVWAILDVLRSMHGAGARLGAEEVRPFLGERGTVPPWELTDAIAAGDIGGALGRLRRLCGPAGMHPMQVTAILANHFERLLRLDGSTARDEAGAAVVLRAAGLMNKGGSTFPARKALRDTRRLGSTRIARAFELLAAADLDLRGRTALEPEVVLEVLVARLSQLHRRR